MGFRENLIRLRENAGYKTANSFADFLKIPRSTYATYESPTRPREPKYELLCKIADTLHCTIDELLGHAPQNKYDKMYKYLADLGFLVRDDNGRFTVLSGSEEEGYSPLCTYATEKEIRRAMVQAYYDYYNVTKDMRRYVFAYQFFNDNDTEEAGGYYLDNPEKAPDISLDIDTLAEVIEELPEDEKRANDDWKKEEWAKMTKPQKDHG